MAITSPLLTSVYARKPKHGAAKLETVRGGAPAAPFGQRSRAGGGGQKGPTALGPLLFDIGNTKIKSMFVLASSKEDDR